MICTTDQRIMYKRFLPSKTENLRSAAECPGRLKWCPVVFSRCFFVYIRGVG